MSGRTSNQQNCPPRRPSGLAGEDVSGRRVTPRTLSQSVLTRVAADLQVRLEARDRQHSMEAGTKSMGRGQPDMRLRMNALLEKTKWNVFTKRRAGVGFLPARQKLEVPIKHVLKKRLPIWWMACRIRYSIVLSPFNVSVRKRVSQSRQLLDLVQRPVETTTSGNTSHE